MKIVWITVLILSINNNNNNNNNNGIHNSISTEWFFICWNLNY